MPPRVLILRAPGINCDHETQFAFQQAGGIAQSLYVEQLLTRPQSLEDYQVLCFPGGFCYGDDLGAGRILANKIKVRLTEALCEFRDAGKLILGICNGFQALLQTGLLLAEGVAGPSATLTFNQSGHFEDRWVLLGAQKNNRCVFLSEVDEMYLPVAHAEGQFVVRDPQEFQRLEAAGQLVLRYLPARGDRTQQAGYPDNPNGSMGGVAGVCDMTGRVFGLMPHPERFVDPTHHPRWTRYTEPCERDGLNVFQNAVNYFR